MRKMREQKKEIYELIHKLISGIIDETEFSDAYFFIFIYNHTNWKNSEDLNRIELLLLNQLAVIAKELTSFTEAKHNIKEIAILKEKLKNKSIEISKKLFIYYLLEQYFFNEVSTIDFCNKFYDWYDLGTYRGYIKLNEQKWLDELSTLTGRYSEFKEGHDVDPKAFTSETEIKKKVKEILRHLQLSANVDS